jgi:hypothetical protein
MLFAVAAGFTVILYEEDVPIHPLAVGVIVISAVIAPVVVFAAVNAGIDEVVPLAVRPIAVLLFVQV